MRIARGRRAASWGRDGVSRRTAWAIARERGWTSLRHAELLAVCRLQADVLVTVDPELARLADGIVEVFGLDRLTRPDRDGSERRPAWLISRIVPVTWSQPG